MAGEYLLQTLLDLWLCGPTENYKDLIPYLELIITITDDSNCAFVFLSDQREMESSEVEGALM